jgi:signal peptidase I
VTPSAPAVAAAARTRTTLRGGYVYINGKKLNESYIKDRRDFESWPARKIAEDNYFMMGDNRKSSCDSRKRGTLPRASIIGRVVAVEQTHDHVNLFSAAVPLTRAAPRAASRHGF